MSDLTLDIREFHWALQVMNTIDVGLVVVDKDYKVCLWNDFMQNYSGINADQIMQKNLFTAVEGLPENWLKVKIDASIELQSRGFSSWDQRPHIFNFKNYSPLSQGVEIMYQNLVITPLKSLSGDISHICLMIQDVTDVAKSKLHLKDSNQKLETLSRMDGLTKLFNRGYWESSLATEFDNLLLTHEPSSLVMFDIDHFKKVNDTYGHGAGDEVIRLTAKELKKTVRTTDLCGRYGGEEFTVLLPSTTADQAYYFAERLRKRIEKLAVKANEESIGYTISLGICEFNPLLTSHHEWLQLADQALYQSKRDGRNKTTVFGEAVA